MDNLLRQMRLKYPETRREINKEEQGSRRERYLAPQNSQSFREKKTTAGWLGRQLSKQMSRGNEFSDDGIESVTAVAAAVFAIHSVQDSEIARRKKNADRPETSSFPKFTNLKEDTRPPTPRSAPEPAKVPRRLSDKDLLRDPEEGPGRNVAVISEQQKQKPKENITDSGDGAYFKETISFSGNKPDISGGGRTEPEKPVAVPIPRSPTPPISQKPFTGPTDTKKPGPIQTRPSDPRETKADLWEKAELAKIKEKYQKVDETISYWESKKKDKAMRKLEESQAVGLKRAKRQRGRKKFEEDMEFIKQIAAEARAKADGKRRNDILKANQKADIIRKTGDLPVTCYCC